MSAEHKIEHLKLIQAVIARMGTNSFLLKGWTVTLVSALFAFGAKEADRAFIVIAWVPVLVFAGLDAYFLRRERLYRALYGKMATAGEDAVADFSLDTRQFEGTVTWHHSLLSKTSMGFYLPVAGLLAILTLYFALSPRTVPTPIQGKTITISVQ